MNEELLAYFITWTCYGTFLPGDDRGWTKWHRGEQLPQPSLLDWCHERLRESPVRLNQTQRKAVNDMVRKHCTVRNWKLHAVNCRSNHCHVVVTAAEIGGERVRDQLKSWATRELKRCEQANLRPDQKRRSKWWSRKGSVRHIFDEESLEAAIAYTRDAQDLGGSNAHR